MKKKTHNKVRIHGKFKKIAPGVHCVQLDRVFIDKAGDVNIEISPAHRAPRR